ncbi:MAG: 4'-phosphopantetheinyl transferase [Pararhodobacter sp.]
MRAEDEALIRRQLLRLAAEVFPGRVSVGIAPVQGVSLKPEEETAMARAVPSRRAEFSAGRAAAREALGWDVVVPMGPDRAPVWPEGVTGSITHAGGWALAVVGEGLVGIDLEVDEPLPEDVRETVLLPAERDTDGHQARLIFSAKECAYKAQYPLTRELFDFQTLGVTLGEGLFRAELQRPVGPFRRGAVLEGRFAIGGGFILTGIG